MEDFENARKDRGLNEELSSGAKLLFLLFPASVLSMPFAFYYQIKGFKRKMKMAFKFMNYGIFGYLGLVLIIEILHLITS